VKANQTAIQQGEGMVATATSTVVETLKKSAESTVVRETLLGNLRAAGAEVTNLHRRDIQHEIQRAALQADHDTTRGTLAGCNTALTAVNSGRSVPVPADFSALTVSPCRISVNLCMGVHATVVTCRRGLRRRNSKKHAYSGNKKPSNDKQRR
jgi:hypothetical protein